MKAPLLVAGVLMAMMSMPSHAALDARAVHEITVLCKQLYADYAVYRDHVDPDAFANTFTEDGELALVDESVIGREALRKYIADHRLPPDAHMIMITTPRIEVESDTRATGIANAIVLSANRSAQSGEKPVEMDGITGSLIYHANFELTDQGWKIAKIALERAFRGPSMSERERSE